MRLPPARQKELLRRLAETLPKLRRGERVAYYRRLARRFGVSVDTIRYYVGRGAGLPPVQAGNPDLLDTAPMRRPPTSAAKGDAGLSETSKIPNPDQ
jgi:hypothetical protein